MRCCFKTRRRIAVVVVFLYSWNLAVRQCGAGTHVFFVAPRPRTTADGFSRKSAADFRDMKFWKLVQQSLQEQPTVVNLLDGKYVISSDPSRAQPPLHLADIGHPQNKLTIQGVSRNGTVFTRADSDSMDGDTGPGFLRITRSQNITVRRLHFTATHPIGYATHFGGSKNMLIDECTWIDLPGVYYGATGTSGTSTNRITFSNCVFVRVGSSIHAHMAYNAYGPQRIYFLNCHFEDCAGDYVRFRAGTEFGVVAGCTFKSTGQYRGVNMPFITIPLFNDENPADGANSRFFEYFGTNFLIFNNSFFYENERSKGVRAAVLFHHSGFDPPQRNHLLAPSEASLLASGRPAEKQAVLLKNLGIDADRVYFVGNKLDGVEFEVGYRCDASYGAKSRGWTGIIDISDVINRQEVVDCVERAAEYYD